MRGVVAVLLEAIVYVLVFVLVAFFSGVLFAHLIADPALMLLASQCAASVVTCVVFLSVRWTPARECVVCRQRVPFWCALLVLSFAVIVIMEFVEEALSLTLPAAYEATFRAMMAHRWGYVVLAIVAPLAEEVVFRGAVLRKLLSLPGTPWLPIVLSSLLFAAIHGNVAQGCNAFLCGILLGWLYVRTASLLPSLVVHCANNSVAFFVVRLSGDEEVTVRSLCGDNTMLLVLLLSAAVLAVVGTLWYIARQS